MRWIGRRWIDPRDFLTFLALGFVFGGLAFAAWLGPKKSGKVKDDNFECGIEQYGNARSPFSVKYFLIAILFVLIVSLIVLPSFMIAIGVGSKTATAPGSASST